MILAVFDNDLRAWRPATVAEPHIPVADHEDEYRADRLRSAERYLRRRRARKQIDEVVRLQAWVDEISSPEYKAAEVEEIAALASDGPDDSFLQKKAAFESEHGALDDSKSNLWREWQKKQLTERREQVRRELREWGEDATYTEAQAENFQRDVMSGKVPMPSKNVVSFTQQQPTPLPDLILNSAEFVAGFVPPDFLFDGIFQLGFFYSLTAQTGTGKTAIAMLLAAHVASGRPLGGRDVKQGSVIYFAGENPTDVRMRWLALTRAMGLDLRATPVHFLDGVKPLSTVAASITSELQRKAITPALVIVDTSAAYNEGDDENSNTQAAMHARRLRSLTQLPGNPCVIVLCHPAKRAGDDDLIPRGGGAFLAEVDGNVALRRNDSLIVAQAFGKFRGSDAWFVNFTLETVRDHPVLKDTRGRFIPSVIARSVDDESQVTMERAGRADEDALLRAVDRVPGSSPTDLARALGWRLRPVNGKEGAPNHVKVGRMLKRLAAEKLVEERRGGWRLTERKGQRELNEMDMSRPQQPPFPLPR